jgi:hypothetical protein
LFNKPPPQCPDGSWTIAQQLKEKGIKEVSEHNENWMGKALDVSSRFVGLLPLGDDFTGEDLRLMLESTEVGSPKHPNAYGALINTLIKRKIIVPTGEHRQMKDRTSHSRSTPVYKSAT